MEKIINIFMIKIALYALVAKDKNKLNKDIYVWHAEIPHYIMKLISIQ